MACTEGGEGSSLCDNLGMRLTRLGQACHLGLEFHKSLQSSDLEHHHHHQKKNNPANHVGK